MDNREEAPRRGLWIVANLGTVIAIVVIGFFAGYLCHWVFAPARGLPAGSATRPAPSTEQPKQTIWTCSMHPQIRRTEPGQCPICGMDLVPAETLGLAMVTREFSASDQAKALMDIEIAPVERKFVTAQIRMVGKIDYDETRLAYITAWVPGRLDRLFVDYTGIPVRKGDHMVELYSPKLLETQDALLEGLRTLQRLASSEVGIVRQTAEATVAATRERLRLWGLTDQQIGEIEKRGTPSDHVTIYAPQGGIVIHKNAQQGMYVETGTRIYTIADLSEVWVKLDAYESDLAWLRYGQPVSFTTVSYPGETFTGTISFIDPVLDSQTRTVKVRVEAPNAPGKLKPGMFVKAVAAAQVAEGGRVMDKSLAGKWICPMHPSVVKDGPGQCDICQMPLVRTESLGYVTVEPTEADKPLVIPASAPLVTGTRAVVYVEVPGREKPTYEGREIELGLRAGDYYLVRAGLKEGENVVVRGNFKIDSALQIQARPSMMAPEGRPPPVSQARSPRPTSQPMASGQLPKQLEGVFSGYFEVRSALAADKLPAAVASAAKAREALAAVDGKLLSEADRKGWGEHAGHIEKLLASLAAAGDIESARREFAVLSEQMAAVARQLGPPGGLPLYEIHCPMAFDGRGANWLQTDRAVANPYFGSAMLQCGDVVEVIRPRGSERASTSHEPSE